MRQSKFTQLSTVHYGFPEQDSFPVVDLGTLQV